MKSYFVVTKIKFKELPFTSRCIIKIRIWVKEYVRVLRICIYGQRQSSSCGVISLGGNLHLLQESLGGSEDFIFHQIKLGFL